MVGRQGGDGLDFRMPHENGVALHMAEARGVPNHPGIENLLGLVLGHRPGDHPSAGPLARQDHIHLGLRHLLAVGQELLIDHRFRLFLHHHFGVAFGGVHPPQLGGVQLDGGPFLQVDHCLGVHDPLAGSLSLAVVLLHVLHLGVLPHVKGVHPVVLGGFVSGVVDAAAGHNHHVAVGPDVEVVVDQLVQPGLGDDDGNVDRLVLGPGLDVDVNAGLVRFGDDFNIGRVAAGFQLAVFSDVVGALWGPFQVRNLPQETGIYLVHGLTLLRLPAVLAVRL